MRDGRQLRTELKNGAGPGQGLSGGPSRGQVMHLDLTFHVFVVRWCTWIVRSWYVLGSGEAG